MFDLIFFAQRTKEISAISAVKQNPFVIGLTFWNTVINA